MRQEIKNFTGGITDYIQTSDVQSFEVLNNMEITKDRDLVSRSGSRLYGNHETKPTIATPECQLIAELKDYKIFFHGKQFLTLSSDTYSTYTGVNGDSVLSEGGINSNISVTKWNDQLIVCDTEGSKPIKVFVDDNGDLQARTCGLPVPSNPTVTPTTNDNKSYVYTFIYTYQYKVGDVTFLDASGVTSVQVSNGSATQNDISNIPVLVNTAATHYDVANIKVQIYRTTHEGSTSYLVGEVVNGTTTFNDTVLDTALTNNLVLYTDGGVPNNDEPPIAKYVEVVDNACFYANTKEYPYRVWQSQVADPDSVPASFYTDFEESIVGLSSFQSNLIVFTENQIWRIEGLVDRLGAGLQRKVLVADKVGCLNANSVVKTDKGVLFAGVDSFYVTNGYEINKAPEEEKNFYKRYAFFAQHPDKIQGTYDRIQQRVYWTTQSGASRYDIYVFDLTFNAFCTWSGRSGSFDTTSILATRKGEIIRGNQTGHVFIHDGQDYGDPIVDVMKLIPDWQEWPVIYTIRHIENSFGYDDLNKWVTKCTITGDGQTDLDCQINSYDNSFDVPKPLKEVSFRSGQVWGDEEWVWGNNEEIWGLERRMIASRRFRAGRIRTKTKQLEITNSIARLRGSFTGNADSQVVCDGTSKQVTLVNSSIVSFPENVIGKTLVVNGREYEIVDSGTDTIKVEDAANNLPNGQHDWEVKGYAHNQQMHLSSIIYTFTPLDDDGGYFQKGADA